MLIRHSKNKSGENSVKQNLFQRYIAYLLIYFKFVALFICMLSIASIVNGQGFDDLEADENQEYLYSEEDSIHSYTEMTKGELEAYASENLRQDNFDAEEWAEITKGYQYDSVQPEKQKLQSQEIDTSFFVFLLQILKVLGIIVIVGVVALILYQLLGVNIFSPKNRKLNQGTINEITLENIEEHLEDSDLKSFIQQALNNGNYKLAIRLYYLYVLQALTLNKNINWKRDKTNKDYARELKDSPYRTAFQKVTAIFERVWYGEKVISKEEYDNLEPDFENLVKKVDDQASS